MSKSKHGHWLTDRDVFKAQCNNTLTELLDTNKRLNRRCQEAESQLLTLRRELHGLPEIVQQLQSTNARANHYANMLRELSRHRKDDMTRGWQGCWCCRFRRFVRRVLWNKLFAMK